MKVSLVSKDAQVLKVFVHDASFLNAGTQRQTRFARQCWAEFQPPRVREVVNPAGGIDHIPMPAVQPKTIGIVSQKRGSGVAVIIRAH